jgi:hypothetical protein
LQRDASQAELTTSRHQGIETIELGFAAQPVFATAALPFKRVKRRVCRINHTFRDAAHIDADFARDAHAQSHPCMQLVAACPGPMQASRRTLLRMNTYATNCLQLAQRLG